MPLVIDKKLCPQNHKCPLLTSCPTNAITQAGHGLPIIDAEKCIKCGKCIKNCGMGAIYKKE